MVMDLIEPGNAPGSLAPERRLALLEEVIEIVNLEFPASLLRAPEEADRRSIELRIRSLVSAAFRSSGLPPDPVQEQALSAEIAHRVMGLGFLDPLLPPARTDLSEITVYSSGLVQVMKKGSVRWEDAGVEVEASEVWRVLHLLLGPQSRAVNEAVPSVNARLPATQHNPGGGRVKVLHPAIAPGNGYPSVNIRLFEQKPVQPGWLLERRVMSEPMMDFLGQAMRFGSRILICGATRTGKTTLLSALCSYLPPAWRVVKIEDPQEIWLDRKTVQTVEARPHVPGSQVPAYSLADGVDDAMRMSPDYLVVGEVRDGQAAMALLRALMTGHAGACTLHADSPAEALERLVTLMGSDKGVSPKDSARMIAASVDLLVQIGIVHEQRRVTVLAEIDKTLQDGQVQVHPRWLLDDASPADHPAWIQPGP